jgi:hypothetical protein
MSERLTKPRAKGGQDEIQEPFRGVRTIDSRSVMGTLIGCRGGNCRRTRLWRALEAPISLENRRTGPSSLMPRSAPEIEVCPWFGVSEARGCAY